MPALMSQVGAPCLTGGRPGSPGVAVRPDIACAMRSQAPRPGLGGEGRAAAVRVPTGTAEPGTRAMYHSGIERSPRLVPEPELFHRPLAVVLGDDVGVHHHSLQRVLRRGQLEVERDAALV